MALSNNERFAALKAGNVEYLKLFHAADKDNVEYLKSLCKTPEGKLQAEDARCYQNNPNILHIAVANNNGKFVHAICERLSIQKMLLDKDDSGDTPLHDAATFKRKEIAKVLVDAYITACAGNNDTNLNAKMITTDKKKVDLPTSCPPPWRVRNNNFQTPADIALTIGEDDLAGFLLSPENPDSNLSGGKIIDPLRGAVRLKRGYIQHLISAPDDIISFEKKFGAQGLQILEDGLGKTVLHMAAENNMVEVTKAVLKIDIKTASTLDQLKEDNCFHVAARMGRLRIAQVLVDTVGASGLMKPWRQKDKDGNTPLHLALLHEHKEIAALLISEDGFFLCAATNKKNQSPLTIAMDKGSNFKQIVEQIVALEVPYSIDGFTLQMFVRFAKEFSEDKTRNLIKQHPKVLDLDHGQTNILHYALAENCGSVVDLLLEIYPYAIDKDVSLMFKACSKGDMRVIRAICRYCPQAARFRRRDKSTALHHVKLHSLEQYEELLTISEFSRLKNMLDAERRTPLMKAIRDNNIDLAEALLKMKKTIGRVDVMTLKDNDGKTAADMLLEKADKHEEWEELYAEFTRNMGINLGEVRNTLSVVAALIATITFAAAFTVPGGFDSESGQIVLGHRASFIVFILSDTYAMCWSMMVIYDVAFTMAWYSHKALFYIDRSVFALRQSLYGTLVAFITGIYSVEVGKALWVVIIAAFMCCLIPFYGFLLASSKKSKKSAPFLRSTNRIRDLHHRDEDQHRDEDLSNNVSDQV